MPSCTEPGITNGVVLTSIALKSYSAAAFNATVASASETNSAAATSFIHIFFFNHDIKLLFVSHFVTDLLSPTWNYMDMYNLQTSGLNNLWMSAWTALLYWILGHIMYLKKICLIGKLWVLIKQITQSEIKFIASASNCMQLTKHDKSQKLSI